MVRSVGVRIPVGQPESLLREAFSCRVQPAVVIGSCWRQKTRPPLLPGADRLHRHADVTESPRRRESHSFAQARKTLALQPHFGLSKGSFLGNPRSHQRCWADQRRVHVAQQADQAVTGAPAAAWNKKRMGNQIRVLDGHVDSHLNADGGQRMSRQEGQVKDLGSGRIAVAHERYETRGRPLRIKVTADTHSHGKFPRCGDCQAGRSSISRTSQGPGGRPVCSYAFHAS